MKNIFFHFQKVLTYILEILHNFFDFLKHCEAFFRITLKGGTLMGFPYHDCLMLQLISFLWFSNNTSTTFSWKLTRNFWLIFSLYYAVGDRLICMALPTPFALVHCFFHQKLLFRSFGPSVRLLVFSRSTSVCHSVTKWEKFFGLSDIR